ncbi:MAG: cytochrome b/b6 domain-containing protein [Elusimicrobia bacterium]|nr:cytochrome b/b6 domain-containing protein [Elusimicrobiota bacterium]
MGALSVVLTGLLLTASASAAKLPDEAAACQGCHSKDGGAPNPRLGAYARSVHKDLSCTSCHTQAGEMPHGKLEKADCGMCHADPAAGLTASPHGAALKARFGTVGGACGACHGHAHEAVKARDPKSPTARVNQFGTCGGCHADPQKTPAKVARQEPVKSYLKTVHGAAMVQGSTAAASCSDCHGSHDIRPGLDSASGVNKTHIAGTCGKCHKEEARQYRASVHGHALADGAKEAPTCTDCHGEHSMQKAGSAESSVSSGTVTKTCSACHASEKLAGLFKLPSGQVQSFLDSYHGLAAKNGHGIQVANCASCHGWHDVLPSSDPASRIHPDKVAKTCGQCHAGAGIRLGTGKVHQALSGSGDGSAAAGFFRALYLLLIPLTIGGMLFHNFADLGHKSLTGDLRPMRAEEDPMLSGGERLQHAVLAVSFILLGYSGFALKFPGQWWDLPFQWLGGEAFRRSAHRAAALVFVLLSCYHAYYLLLTKAGFGRLKVMLPALRDARDPAGVLLYNLGLSKKRPMMARFSYIEKAEYWALVWGSGVMVVTGAVLVFDTMSLRLLPLWAIESARVIHFMEAVLACLAILVWHWYWVIFDPEVYPMNWAWLTGRVRLKGTGHGHPLSKEQS